MTNRDGDKTPINDDDFLEPEDADRVGSISRSGNRSRNSKQQVTILFVIFVKLI